MKRFLSVFLAVFLILSLSITSGFATESIVLHGDAPVAHSFSDVNGSPFEDAVEYLWQRGIVVGVPGGSFAPDKYLSRAEAAVLIQRAFQLVPITPQDLEDQPELSKVRAYSGALGTVNESFTVSAAKDTIGLWAQPSVESILNVTLMETVDETFNPAAPMTSAEFSALLANALYGPEKPGDHLASAIEAGYIDAGSDTPITRGEAAAALAGLLQKSDVQSITMFVTSDIHGHLLPYTPSGSAVAIGSVARMAAIVNAHKEKYPDTFLIDGGDSPYNQNIANLFEGNSTIDVMNAMGYTATVLGNHDFDMSFENLGRLADRAEYDFLSANTYMKDGTFPEFLKESVVFETGGVTFGIIGLTDDQSKETTHYANTVDIDFADDIETAGRLIPALAEETDVVVVLSHLHGKNDDLLLAVEGIDVSVGGGQDLLGQPAYIGDSWLLNPGKHAECVNQVVLNLIDGKVVGLLYNQILLSANLPEDPEVAGIIADYLKQMDDKMNTVVGSTTVDLNGERETVRFKESNLGNLIADALRTETGTDIAFQNGGGIRASAPAGDITLEQVYAMLPFDNLVTVLDVSGQVVWDAIANSAASAGTAHGKYLQVSGLSYVYDSSLEGAERLVSVTMADGTPIDLKARYTLVCNDFMAGGGDGYTMLNALMDSDPELPLNPDVTLLYKTKTFLRELFHEYLMENSPVAPVVEDRIIDLALAQ